MRTIVAVFIVLELLACQIQAGSPPSRMPDTERSERAESPPRSRAASTGAEVASAAPEATSGTPAALSKQDERAPEPPAAAQPAAANANPGPSAKKSEKPSKPPHSHGHDHKVEPPGPAAAKTPAPAPASEPAPAAVAPQPSPPPPSDQRIVQRIVVRIRGVGAGVAASIYRVDPQDQQAYFAKTGASGVAEPGAPCKLDDRFEVKPDMPYLRVDMQPCAAKIDFELAAGETMMAMSKLGDEAMKNGNFGLAQSYYATVAKWLRKDDPRRADEALSKANLAAARALGTSNDGKQLSPHAIDALREYQRKSNLKVTGELDAPTQHKLSGIDEDEAMRRATAKQLEKPPAKQKEKRPAELLEKPVMERKEKAPAKQPEKAPAEQTEKPSAEQKEESKRLEPAAQAPAMQSPEKEKPASGVRKRLDAVPAPALRQRLEP